MKCRGQGCHLQLKDAEICHRCAVKERRALRRKRADRPEPAGWQDRLFTTKQSPREQNASWRNRHVYD